MVLKICGGAVEAPPRPAVNEVEPVDSLLDFRRSSF